MAIEQGYLPFRKSLEQDHIKRAYLNATGPF